MDFKEYSNGFQNPEGIYVDSLAFQNYSVYLGFQISTKPREFSKIQGGAEIYTFC